MSNNYAIRFEENKQLKLLVLLLSIADEANLRELIYRIK